MNVSVELTYSPLKDDYEPEIIRLIQALRGSGLNVVENPLSTHVYGDYELVFSLLQREIKQSLQGVPQGVFFLKLVKTDRSGYEPHF